MSRICMTVYRNDDPTDTADIGWDVNGIINVSQILTFRLLMSGLKLGTTKVETVITRQQTQVRQQQEAQNL